MNFLLKSALCIDEATGKKRPSRKNLRGVQQAFYMEKEMGSRLGRRKVLQ